MARPVLARLRSRKGALTRNRCNTPWFDIGLHFWEPIDVALIKAVWVEFVCMVVFIYIATGAVVFGCHSTDANTSAPTPGGTTAQPQDCFVNSSRVLTIATGFGMTIFVLVYLAASFSGGHINPAVTLGFVLTNKISILRAILYWIVQFVGAIVGSALVYATDHVGYTAAKGASNRLLEGFPGGAGWLLECILTFTLVLVVFAATDTARAQNTAHLPVLAPAAIGFTVWVDHLAAIAIDGCSINPARSFGPAVVGSNWHDMWIWFIGPLSGGAIAALVYEITFRPSPEPILPVDATGDEEELAKLPGYTGVQGLDQQARDVAHSGDGHARHHMKAGHGVSNGTANGGNRGAAAV